MQYKDDEKWPIPEKFRASMDVTDEAAYAMLQKCDEEQRKRAEASNTPFFANTPQEQFRARAATTLKTLEQAQAFGPLVDQQLEQMAECYAAIGRYDMAAETSINLKEHYREYWNAIFKPDGSWCAHPVKHAYLKERIFSLKHGREKSMMCCNVCGFLNVTTTPTEIVQMRSSNAAHRGATRGMTIEQCKAYHQQNVKR